MARLIGLTDDKKRDAHVTLESPRREATYRQAGPAGLQVRLERVVKTTERTRFEALVRDHGGVDGLGQALVSGDPELDLTQAGRRLHNPSRVYLTQEGTVLYSARLIQVVYGPDGAEKARQDFVDVEATIGESEAALPWTGRLISFEEAVHKFAFTRKFQLRHVNGLTFDFLHHIAKTLETAGKLLLVGSGPKGQAPLIFTTNGSPFRGFLEGRTDGAAYRLVLHLSNQELKRASV